MLAVGKVGSFLERYEPVAVAGHKHFDIVHVSFKHSLEFKCHIEVDALFICAHSQCSGIFASVSGVYDYYKVFSLCYRSDAEQEEYVYYCI